MGRTGTKPPPPSKKDYNQDIFPESGRVRLFQTDRDRNLLDTGRQKVSEFLKLFFILSGRKTCHGQNIPVLLHRR